MLSQLSPPAPGPATARHTRGMDDWELWAEEFEPQPLSTWDRRRTRMRWIALIVVIAMILALLIPVIVRIVRSPDPPERGTVTVLGEHSHENRRQVAAASPPA